MLAIHKVYNDISLTKRSKFSVVFYFFLSLECSYSCSTVHFSHQNHFNPFFWLSLCTLNVQILDVLQRLTISSMFTAHNQGLNASKTTL